MWSAWLLQYIALFSGIFHQCIGNRYELYDARIFLRFDGSRKWRRCSKTGAQNANAWKRLVLMVSKSAVRDPMRHVYVDNSIETNSFASCVSVYLPLKTTVSPTYINWFVGKTKIQYQLMLRVTIKCCNIAILYNYSEHVAQSWRKIKYYWVSNEWKNFKTLLFFLFVLNLHIESLIRRGYTTHTYEWVVIILETSRS